MSTFQANSVFPLYSVHAVLRAAPRWYYEYVCLTDLDLLDEPGGELLLPDLDARGLAVVARLHALLVVQAQHLTPTAERKHTRAHTCTSQTQKDPGS